MRIMEIIIAVVALIAVFAAMEDRLEAAGESMLLWLARIFLGAEKSPRHLPEPKH
jgi:hypothetical protein